MTTQPTLTLTEFLLARIAEDEAVARACAEVYPAPWDVSDRGHSATVQADEPDFPIVAALDQDQARGGWVGDRLEHIARHDPARVLAECETKRRIVEEFTSAADWSQHPDCPDQQRDVYRRRAGSVLDVQSLLALPYADHPDYDEKWRP